MFVFSCAVFLVTRKWMDVCFLPLACLLLLSLKKKNSLKKILEIRDSFVYLCVLHLSHISHSHLTHLSIPAKHCHRTLEHGPSIHRHTVVHGTGTVHTRTDTTAGTMQQHVRVLYYYWYYVRALHPPIVGPTKKIRCLVLLL